MKLLIACALVLGLCIVAAPAEARVKFPKEKDLEQFRKVCAGGDVSGIQYRVDEAIHEWKTSKEARKDMESARRQLGAVIEKITPSAGGVALYESYVSCVRDLIEKYLARANSPREPINPGDGVSGFMTLGMTYGSIRTDDQQVLTNDNRMIGLARVGWWFNNHIAVGLEGSYWQAEAKKAEFNGQRVQLTQSLRNNAATATLPLYIHFGRRFPLVLYAGAGIGWESNDVPVFSANGTVLGRDTMKDSGLALVAGAGFEFSTGPNSSVTILVRGIRTTIDSPSVSIVGQAEKRPPRDILSFGVAMSFH